MLTKFSAEISSKLADHWVQNVLTTSFIFWIGGLLAWVYRFGWDSLLEWIIQQEEVIQIILAVVSLLVITASAEIIRRIDISVIRFLEGYWPTWLSPILNLLQHNQSSRYNRMERRFQQINSRIKTSGGSVSNNLTKEEMEEYINLDCELRRLPQDSKRLMPTRLGNILRAAEMQSYDKYGLDAIVCWPRLWLILPDNVKEEITSARNRLNTLARLWLWCLLFVVWTIWAWWAALAGLVVAVLVYRWILSAAETYGDLVEAAFDINRVALYQALRWPLPSNPIEERQSGLTITEYLWRGSDKNYPIFTMEDQS